MRTKFEMEPFEGKNNFSMWQNMVKDILVQQELIKTLIEKQLVIIKDNSCEEFQQKAMSIIN